MLTYKTRSKLEIYEQNANLRKSDTIDVGFAEFSFFINFLKLFKEWVYVTRVEIFSKVFCPGLDTGFNLETG